MLGEEAPDLHLPRGEGEGVEPRLCDPVHQGDRRPKEEGVHPRRPEEWPRPEDLHQQPLPGRAGEASGRGEVSGPLRVQAQAGGGGRGGRVLATRPVRP